MEYLAGVHENFAQKLFLEELRERRKMFISVQEFSR